MKCETPAFAIDSSREPAPIQSPIDGRADAVDVLGDDPLPAGEGREAVGFHAAMVVGDVAMRRQSWGDRRNGRARELLTTP